MNQNNLLAILRENRLMQTQQQVTNFENALAQIADNPNEQNLSAYHLVLSDRCEQPEVMFSLIHFIESFDIEEQIAAFIQIIPQLMTDAPEWTRIMHNRIINDDSACQVYQKLLHSANINTPHFLYHLLEESIANKLKNQEILPSITQ